MTIELQPTGVACSRRCSYCYQEPMRAATHNKLPPKPADGWARMKAKAESMCDSKNRPGFFGGEAMLLPDEDLEDLFAWAHERFGGSGVQSEGSLMRPHHFDLFDRYKVQPGFSIDGPGELNRARVAGTVENTDKATERSIWALEEALRRGYRTSLHVVLHRVNALPGELLDRLVAWLHDLDARGLRWLTIHPLERDGPAADALALSEDQLVEALERLDHEVWINLRVGLLADMRNLLLDPLGAKVPCIWNACDPLTTPAVQGIGPTGEMHNCGRVNKLGADAPKADGQSSHERYLMLHRTPQEDGGCQDCRFFAACKGFCPGTAVDGDWRMKTEHCGALMRTFERLEVELLEAGKIPYSVVPSRVRDAEASLIAQWSGQAGGHESTEHGDAAHGDAPHGDAPHGDSHEDSDEHGDSPHGDMHQDSDAPGRVVARGVLPIIADGDEP